MSDEEDPASSYAGRWVARLRGRIIAQGGTPELARRAAKSSRHKESPEISYMPAAFSLPSVVNKVMQALPPNQEIHLVGGAVRDMLLGRDSHDFDFSVPSNGIALARRVADVLEADFNPLDTERDIGRVIVVGQDGTRILLDFARYRDGDTIEADLNGRDLTVNAMAYDLRAETIIDPLEGAADLRARRLRTCSASAFVDDPVRVLRAIRLAAELGFKIESRTRDLMQQAAARLESVSPERLRDEALKLLEGPKPDDSIRAMDMLGALPHVFPELPVLKGVTQSPPHVHDVWVHTLSMLKHLESILETVLVDHEPAEEMIDSFVQEMSETLGRFRERIASHVSKRLNPDRSARGLIFLATLYHDVSKPQTRSLDEGGRIRFFGHDEQGAQAVVRRAEALRLSNDEAERLRLIVANHMRFHFMVSRLEADNAPPTRRAIYRFFRDSGEAGVDLILVGLADLRAIQGASLAQETWRSALTVACILLENFWEKPNETVSPPRLVDGNDLMDEFHLEPGPVIGQLLEAIREAQAEGLINTREQSLLFGREWLKENSA
jgi:tRNA nucleotidyltransferase/poly(A) polymerase